MMNDILWVPWLQVPRLQYPACETHIVQLFLKGHLQRGHVLWSSETYKPIPSFSLWHPKPGVLWHVRYDLTTHPEDIGDFNGPIEMAITLEHIPFDLLKTLSETSRLTRIILYRASGQGLLHVIHSIEQLLSVVPGIPLWLDQVTIGWEALAYLLAVFPEVQPFNVQDQGLDQLLIIAQKLNRRVFLSDFSGRAPILVPYLPTFAMDHESLWNMDKLPIYPGYL
ncbi:hypothetical protein [Sulfobacillus thermosulfidooxidans]|uniref:hypothetical protein n=1 Tax=Sulfobacillus thermosulfidooxidans TaxID=28034 RepID=UPI00096BBF35|nr:hypothetical protein [Sulfobacillus thermosulfidooxidans]OLZ10468.1 hypothetical protein BFX05_01110 [Sulfobacillus thermosulfidooxidans]OLZ14276.1 hypothetical protein BFX06_08310 [Sulfobacillus thermosulfidooxidans]OLZ19019.1 hypothetical protein BFX07_04705 [Sulfobacillus thermosulfidooxidans]